MKSCHARQIRQLIKKQNMKNRRFTKRSTCFVQQMNFQTKDKSRRKHTKIQNKICRTRF